MSRSLAKPCIESLLCAALLGLSACSSGDTPEDGVDSDASAITMDSSIPQSESGAGTDSASSLPAADTGVDSSADAARDAATPDSGISLDSAAADAAQASSDAGSALDGATDANFGEDASIPASATPSAGCGKSARPGGGRISVPGDHNYTFPAAYDGRRPFPLLIGFHAAGNPIEQIENLTKGSEFETSFVRAFPKSKGSAWDYNADIAKVRAMYDDLMANYCIDTSRVFATGHSSGAQLIVQILTPAHKADADHLRFKAVAPVAASRYGAVSRAIPVMYIQGARDNVRNSDGGDVVKEFVSVNGCATTSKPYAGPMCMSGGRAVKDGCIQYEGCKTATVWCSHDDPVYSNTNHGWPCFATKAMYEFFSALL